MTQEIERRAFAFIRTLANRCERCLRRSDENCRPCASAWANSIMQDYEAESRTLAPSHSFAGRCMKIIGQLAESPLTADKIDYGESISAQLKYYTLRVLMERGVVARRKLDMRPKCNITYEYFLTEKAKGVQNENHIAGIGECKKNQGVAP